MNLDIKPGSCPNPVNAESNGVVPVVIIGSLNFDVTTIDPNSLTLARADGMGDSVSPLSSRRGARIAIEDVATPFDGEPCACHELGGDGIDDLVLKFSTPEMSRVLELNAITTRPDNRACASRDSSRRNEVPCGGLYRDPRLAPDLKRTPPHHEVEVVAARADRSPA